MTKMNLDERGYDWIKQSWDLTGIDNIEKLRALLESEGMTAEHFMTLAVYKANVVKMPWLRELANVSAAAAPPAKPGVLATVNVGLSAAAPTAESAMIAVYPSPEQATAIAQPGGEPADILHTTLVFLGEITEEEGQAIDKIAALVAAKYHTLYGEIGGIGSFFAERPGGEGFPSIALPDVPGLAELHMAVCYALWEAQIPYAGNHGWTPHITIAYTPEISPPSAELLGQPLTYSQLTFARGDVRSDHMLLG